MQSPWLVRPQPQSAAALRLFCFPHAGVGATVYRPWAAELPADVELCAVQLPGRETRLREAPFTDLTELVPVLAEHLLPFLDRPFAFFGHSMGALLAFELARRLASEGHGSPVSLFASGRRAPRLEDREPPLGRLSDDDFLAEIQRRYGGIPAEVLAHRDLVELLLPGLRADITALERYRYAAGEPLDCPLFAFGGAQDSRATPAQLQAWREETRGPFALRIFPGGHFFPQSARAQVIATILMALRHGAAPSALQPAGT